MCTTNERPEVAARRVNGRIDRQNRIKERETDGWVYRKPTSRHTLRRQAGRHANRQTDEQTASKQTDRQADTQTSREAARIGIHKDDRANRQTHKQTERQPIGIHKDDRPTDRHTDKPRGSRSAYIKMTDQQTYTQRETVGSQPDKQAYRQTDERPPSPGWRQKHMLQETWRQGGPIPTPPSPFLSLPHSHTH